MRRLSATAAVLAAAFMIAVPVSLAATPQQIYRDFADNGRLDGHYSKADLQRAQNNLGVQGYGSPTKKGLKHAIKKTSAVKGVNKRVGVAAARSSSGLPFTGVDLALISIGGVSLLAFGVSLRRCARRTNS
jgi:opacity protein-like surface antigen